MKKIKVKTGYGYLKDNEGNTISKVELPQGEHNIKEGYEYIEVKDLSEMNKIKVYELPPSPEVERKRMIDEELQLMAIERLKKRGKIPSN